MSWCKFWLIYDLVFAALSIASAFVESRDLWIRINGWMAITLVVCAVIQWARIESEVANG